MIMLPMELYLIFFSFTTFVLAFNISMLLDGLFVSLTLKGARVTPIGWVYYASVFFVINLILTILFNILSMIRSIISKHKYAVFWNTFIKSPLEGKWSSFENTTKYYFIEIITSVFFAYLSTPIVIIALETNPLLLFPLMTMTVGGFLVIFFKILSLPFPQKARKHVIRSYIIVLLSFAFFIIIFLNKHDTIVASINELIHLNRTS